MNNDSAPLAVGRNWSFRHFDARTVEEAVTLLRRYKEKAKVIAGGTDILNILKDRALPTCPEAVINLKTIPGLDYIEEDADGLKIGPLTRLKNITSSPIVKEGYPLLWEAARSIASPQIRRMATIGGNLCQDVHCWYYRTPHLISRGVLCKRKGGKKCFVLGGDNRYSSIFGGGPDGCYAVCLSDMAIALATLDAEAETSKRRIPFNSFFIPDGKTKLKNDELLTGIRIPFPSTGSKGVYLKFRIRKATDFAIVSVGCLITTEGDICKDARIILGGVAPVPWRAEEAEDALCSNNVHKDAVVASAGEAALGGAKPLAMNGYKISLTEALVKRAILMCC